MMMMMMMMMMIMMMMRVSVDRPGERSRRPQGQDRTVGGEGAEAWADTDEGDLLRRLQDDLAEANQDKSDKSSKSGACDGECRAP
jgi:hypothetical protein